MKELLHPAQTLVAWSRWPTLEPPPPIKRCSKTPDPNLIGKNQRRVPLDKALAYTLRTPDSDEQKEWVRSWLGHGITMTPLPETLVAPNHHSMISGLGWLISVYHPLNLFLFVNQWICDLATVTSFISFRLSHRFISCVFLVLIFFCLKKIFFFPSFCRVWHHGSTFPHFIYH
jgi:hypothetical protein